MFFLVTLVVRPLKKWLTLVDPWRDLKKRFFVSLGLMLKWIKSHIEGFNIYTNTYVHAKDIFRGAFQKNLHSWRTCPLRGGEANRLCPLRKCKFLFGGKKRLGCSKTQEYAKKFSEIFVRLSGKTCKKIASYFFKY